MKSEGHKTKKTKDTGDRKVINKRGYYFHPDDDFREDLDWGKQKVLASKAISKRLNKFEI